jgi:alkyl hydroperoxide reductase subunit AhpC
MFGFKRYNYDEFTKDLLLKDILTGRVGGPDPGDRAPDFEGRSLEGDAIKLSDYRGEKNVVLTFGSATCPFTAASIRGMNELYEEYDGDDVQFLFCYVREAHPGERLSAHRSYQDKVRAAELFRREEEVRMPIIVDEVNGDIHKDYGKLPNATYIIDKSGRVAFRSLWTRPRVIEEALRELLDRQEERDVEHAVVHGGQDTSMPTLYASLHTHRALERGGRRAVRAFRRELGMSGRVALAGSRVVQPIAENPGKSITIAAVTLGVAVGAIFVGRELRKRRLRMRAPYDIERLGIPRRTTSAPGDYEAVGI